MAVDLIAAMEEIRAANEKYGVDVRGGKKYLEVAKRVEIFRKHFQTSAGIITKIEHLGVVRGEPVVVTASITIDGAVIATGTACEVIGDGNVNKASAVENAETSAVGRALAALGLHGGEYASLNEMSRIGVKEPNFAADGLADAWEASVFDALPEEPAQSTVAEAYADLMEIEATAYKSAKSVEGYMKRHEKHLLFIKEHAPDRYGPLRAAAWQHMQKLNEGKAA